MKFFYPVYLKLSALEKTRENQNFWGFEKKNSEGRLGGIQTFLDKN